MTPDVDTARFLQRLEDSGLPHLATLTAAAARAQNDPLAEQSEHAPAPVGSVEDGQFESQGHAIPVRIYRPSRAESAPVLLYFHGGGGVIGSIETHDSLCRSLVRFGAASVVSVGYRLAPEHRFPAALDDATAALRWVADNAAGLGLGGHPIGVGGDSCGGGLAAALAQAARDGTVPPVFFQLLIYPSLDMNRQHAGYSSYSENGSCYFLDTQLIGWFRDNFVRPGQDLTDPLLSPLRCPDLRGLAPALIVTAGLDPLRDEGAAYANALRSAGVPVTYRCFESTIHGFVSMGRFIPAAIDALQLCGTKLRKAGGA